MSQNCVAEDGRPSKRPRLGLPRPDGFIVPPKPPQQRVATISRFVSAFDTKGTSTSRPIGRRQLSDIQPQQAKPDPPRWKVLKPPPMPTSPETASKRSDRGPKRTTPLSALRPAVPDSPGPSRVNLISKPPTFHSPASSSRTASGARLKPLPPPPVLPSRRPPPVGPVKAISETRIARATDIHSEEGAAERLSIFLMQHGHGFVEPTEKELKRGVEQSPEKRSKNKNVKFMRGGLAEAAHRRFSSTATSQLLWETDLARLQGKGRPPRSDLQIHITAILHTPPPRTDKHNVPHAPPTILIEGTVVSSNINEFKLGAITALFRLSENHGVPLKRNEFAVGTVVQVWRPWTSMEMPVDQLEDEGFPFAVMRAVYCFKRYFVLQPSAAAVRRSEQEMERYLYS